MRFILTADWHLRATKPRCRIDEDWIETQKKAINQVLAVALQNESDVVIVGDIFNSNSDTSFQCIQLVQDFAKQLNSKNLSCYILAGNHDLLYHSSENIKKSAIGILLSSENIFLINELFEKYRFNLDEKINYSVANFDEPDNKYADMVFKHVLCFPDMKSLPPNVDAFTAKELTEEFPNADWIFIGDYHHNFYYRKNGKHVVNPGCLLRQAVDFKDYQCGVYFIDTDREIVKFNPIIDDEEFIDDTYILKQEERTERIESFVDKLKKTKNISLDFIDNVKKAMKSNKFDSEMNDLLLDLLGV